MSLATRPSRTALVLLLFGMFGVAPRAGFAQSGTWNVNANGNWDVGANWLGGIIANGADNTATFDAGAAIGGIRTVTLTAPKTIGHLVFNDRDNNDANYWNITSNTLTLATTSGTPTITYYGTGSSSVNWQKDARITSVLAGNQGFTLNYISDGAAQTPRFELYGNNTYSGITDITGGILQTGHANALGAAGTLADRTIVRSGARLHMESQTYAPEIIQLDGGTLSDPVNHSPTLKGLVYLTAPSVVNKQGGGVMTFNPDSGNAIELGNHNITFTGAANTATTLSVNVLKPITGNGAVIIDSSKTGVVAFGGQNTYTGGTSINNGILRLDAAENAGISGPLGASGQINFGGGALQYSAANQHDYSGRFNPAGGQVYRIDLGGQNVTWSSGLSTTSSLMVGGAGGASFPGSLTFAGNYSFTDLTLGINPFITGDLSGSLRITSGNTTVTNLNLAQNANAHGHVRVTGGSLTATNTNLGTVGGASSKAAVIRLEGGSIAAGTINTSEGRPLISVSGGAFTYSTLNLSATGGGTGVFDLSGGTVTGGQANIGASNARAGRVTIRGGTFTATGMTLGSTNTNTFGNLVVSETGVLNLGTSTLNLGGGNGTTGYGTANLVGGTVRAGAIARTGGGTTTANLTFSGGTLQATQNSGTFIQGLTSANIYVGGATIDTQNFNVTVAQPLLGGTGQGVLTIPVLNGGSGYMAPPTLTITGGGGTGATAVANLNQFGVVESITVTNPGSDYTGPITVNVNESGTYGTGFVAGAATFGDNATGGLTKLGAGVLTLSGDNTYTGSTIVSQGTLALANANNNNIASSTLVSLANGTTLNTTGLGGSADLVLAAGQTLKGTGTVVGNLTVSTDATIAPGNSPGTLSQTGNQTWSPGGTYAFEINDATGTAGADPGWSLMAIAGQLDLSSITVGNEFNVAVTSLDLANAPGDIANFDAAVSYAWLMTDADTIVGYTGSDQFNVNIAAFTNVLSGNFSVVRGDEVSGGDDSQLWLLYTSSVPVPEPGSIFLWCLAAVGASVYVIKRRGRK